MFLKKVTVFILLSTFLFNIAGYFIAFKVLQFQIRKEIKSEIKQQLAASELTTIIINKAHPEQISWEEKGKEFYFAGGLYDIISSTETSDSIYYYCINDVQEELLFENLDEHINKYVTTDEFSKNRSAKKLANPSIKLYFTHSISLACDYCYSAIIYLSKPHLYTSAIIEINPPPPEFI